MMIVNLLKVIGKMALLKGVNSIFLRELLRKMVFKLNIDYNCNHSFFPRFNMTHK